MIVERKCIKYGVYVSVTELGGLLTGDLKLECTLLDFENGVL